MLSPLGTVFLSPLISYLSFPPVSRTWGWWKPVLAEEQTHLCREELQIPQERGRKSCSAPPLLFQRWFTGYTWALQHPHPAHVGMGITAWSWHQALS